MLETGDPDSSVFEELKHFSANQNMKGGMEMVNKAITLSGASRTDQQAPVAPHF